MKREMKKKECEDKMVEQSLEKQDRPDSGSGPDPCGLSFKNSIHSVNGPGKRWGTAKRYK